MSTQQQAETEVVTGVVASVITKGPDKWQVAVNTGGQYNRNLWTKDAGLVNQMMGSIGMSFDFICGVSHWTGQSGPVRSLWINGITAAGSTPQQQPVQQAPQQQYQQPVQQQPVQQQYPQPQAQFPPNVQQPQPQAQSNWQGAQQALAQQAQPQVRTSDEERESRIMRQTGMKIAAHMLPYLPPEERTFQGMVTVSEGLVRYFRAGEAAVNGQPGGGSEYNPAYAAQQAQDYANAAAQGEGYENAPHPTDEWPR